MTKKNLTVILLSAVAILAIIAVTVGLIMHYLPSDTNGGENTDTPKKTEQIIQVSTEVWSDGTWVSTEITVVTETDLVDGDQSDRPSNSGNQSETEDPSEDPDDEKDDDKTPEPPPPPEQIIRSPQITGEMTYDQVAAVRKSNNKLIESLTADKNIMAYDKKNDVYYLSVADNAIGNDTGISFAAKSSDGSEVSIVFKENLDEYTIFKPENNKSYFLRVYNGKQYQDAEIIITTMPFLTIETQDSAAINRNDVNCTITLFDGNWQENLSSQVISSQAQIHVRGASSASFPKKPYKINLKTNEYKDQRKLSLLGLRSDDDWVLDAMYIDPTRMHNNLSTHIWNKMSKGHYPTTNSPASKGEYVEVILNGQYIGLYDLMEPVDRKQLDVDENNGVIIKTVSWDGTYFEKFQNLPSAATWMGFELDFPKEYTDVSDWGKFPTLVKVSADYNKKKNSTTESAFVSTATQYFDKENLTDYWLFLTVFSLRDNRGKNLYWSCLDITDDSQKYYITPWDCDLAFGYKYGNQDSGFTYTKLNQHQRDAYDKDYNNDFVLLTQYIDLNVEGAQDLILQKWETLTAEGEPLNLEWVLNRIRKTRTYLVETGAWEREKERWPDSMNPDSDEEFEYMEEWLINRYDWMEERLKQVKTGLTKK